MLVYRNNFSEPNAFATIRNIQANGNGPAGSAAPYGIPGRLDIVDGASIGHPGMWLRTHAGQTDAPTFGGIRSEVAFDVNAMNDELWASFDIMVRRQDWGDQEQFISLWQFHSGDAGGAIRFIAVLRRNVLRMYATNYGLHGVRVMPWTFDKPVRVAMHYIVSDSAVGVFEMWIDRKPVIKMFDVVTASATDTPYLKLGCYDTQHTASFGQRTAYYRRLRVNKGKESTREMLEGLPVRLAA